jgi:large subunit ribosomal protein L23
MSQEHNLIVKPIFTEKSTLERETEGRYYFEVSKTANKSEVKKAIEKLFNVKVDSINILNREGKMKRVRFKEGKTASTKRAIVKLKADNVIKFFEGK